MMDYSILSEYFRKYKQYFPFVFHNRESYKWESVQCFQNAFDANSDDFVEMLKRSLDKSQNLLDNGSVRDRQALLETLAASGDNAKKIFLDLFDKVSEREPEKDITRRIKTFTHSFNTETNKVLPKEDRRNQDTHCASVYLEHRYPDLFYIYRQKDVNGFLAIIDNDSCFTSGAPDNYKDYLSICKSLNWYIKGAIADDPDFKRTISEAIGNSGRYYADPEYHLLTQDFIYFVAHYNDLFCGNLPRKDGPRKWVVPCNRKQYDVDGVLRDYGYTYWRQLQQNKAGIQPQFKPEDIVYIYIAGEGIRYKCRVDESFIPYNEEVNFDLKYWKKGSSNPYNNQQLFAKFELLETNGSKNLSYRVICGLGVPSVRRSTIIPEDLAAKIDAGFNAKNSNHIVVSNRPIKITEIDSDKAKAIIPLPKEISGEDKAYKPDYLKAQKEKSTLGKSGEEFVIEYEKQKLEDCGLGHLSNNIKWVSVHDDSAGYDILSYDDNGKEIFIEVKTTKGSIRNDFFVSANEKAFSELHKESYRLYRLYNYNHNQNSWSLLILKGSLSPLCERATNFAISVSGEEK